MERRTFWMMEGDLEFSECIFGLWSAAVSVCVTLKESPFSWESISLQLGCGRASWNGSYTCRQCPQRLVIRAFSGVRAH